MDQKPRFLTKSAPLIFLFVQVVVFFRGPLFSARKVIPWDLDGYHLPLAEFWARSLRAGELPFWDPFTYCGFPFYANIQTQFSYPPAWITILFSNLFGGNHLLDFLEWQIVLHVFLGGAFTYWLLRRIGLDRGPATFGATIYQLAAYFASQTQHLGAMNAGAWLPLAWLAVISLASRFSWGWLGALSFALTMAHMAGFPAVTIVIFVSCSVLTLTLVLLRRTSPKLLIYFGLGCTWMALLSLYQLLPSMELVRLSIAPQRGRYYLTGGGVPFQALVSMVIPNYYQIFDFSKYSLSWNLTFMYLYFGIGGLIFAVAGAIWSRHRLHFAFLGITIFSLIWMLGDSTPIALTLFQSLPMKLRSPLYAEFAMLSFQMGMACLAALGAQWFLAGRPRWIGAVLVLVTAIDLIAVGSNRPMNTGPRENSVTTDQFEGSPELLAEVRKLVNQTVPPGRVEVYEGSQMWALGAPMLEVPTPNGNDPLALARMLDIRRIFGRGVPWLRYYVLSSPAAFNTAILDMLNVRYVIGYSGKPEITNPRFPKVAELSGHRVYENRTVLPRFFLVNRVLPAKGRREAVGLLRNPAFSPSSEAIVEGSPAFELAGGGPFQPPPVKVLEYGLRRVLLETESPEPAYLVTSETQYPGWNAWVDGQAAQLWMTNASFRGLPVPAGKHRVEMRFEPLIFWLSAALSAPAWLLLLAVAVNGIRKRRMGGRSSAEALVTEPAHAMAD